MHIKSQYEAKLRTKATHLKSGQDIMTDAPVDNNGKGEAFSPTDLVAGALASCMMTIMGIHAQKNGYDIQGMTAETEKIMQAEPRAISKVRIRFNWPNCNLDENEISILKQKALVCPVALSLHPDIKQEVAFGF